MKEITALERDHQRFYAPAFQIRLNGKDLLTSELMEITTVQIDMSLEGFDQFSFTVNSSFDFARRSFMSKSGYDQLEELFAFGNNVEILMGYGDVRSLTLLHRGLITSVKTSFPSSGLPQITVSGYDLSYCMKHEKKSRNWENRKDSEVASEIAGEYKLRPRVQDSRVVHPKTIQNQQTDQEFLKKLAERNGFEVFTFDKQMFFREPAQRESAVISLEWGKSLVSFSPEINISEQVTAVEVRGWNVATKQEIVGKANVGDELGRDSGQRSGGEYVQSACKEKKTLKMRFPVFSQQEANQKARSILKQRSELFVKGSGESIGLPEIRPDTNLELIGLGELFSDTYYVKQATHTISSSGYKTTFKIKDTTI